MHKHRLGPRAPYWVLSSECVVVFVGNYNFADGFTRNQHLGMHLGFRNPRRSQIAPWVLGLFSQTYVGHCSREGSSRPAGIWYQPELAVFEDALFFAFPVAFFDGGAFVVILFALGNRDFEFDPIVLPVHGGGDDGVALALDGADEFV